jgi:hypothetical protein
LLITFYPHIQIGKFSNLQIPKGEIPQNPREQDTFIECNLLALGDKSLSSRWLKNVAISEFDN